MLSARVREGDPRGTPPLPILAGGCLTGTDCAGTLFPQHDAGLADCATGRLGGFDLGKLLPAYVVTDGPTETPSLRLEVAVDAFDVTQTVSVLTASWTITTADDTRARFISYGSFTASLGEAGGDAAIVTAKAETIAKLADAVAATTQAAVVARSSVAQHN